MPGTEVKISQLLRHLLPDNGLMCINASSVSPHANTLQSLDLSSNIFPAISDCLASLVSLRALNILNCIIESVRPLSRNPLPAITVLKLRRNRKSFCSWR